MIGLGLFGLATKTCKIHTHLLYMGIYIKSCETEDPRISLSLLDDIALRAELSRALAMGKDVTVSSVGQASSELSLLLIPPLHHQ